MICPSLGRGYFLLRRDLINIIGIENARIGSNRVLDVVEVGWLSATFAAVVVWYQGPWLGFGYKLVDLLHMKFFGEEIKCSASPS